MNTKNPTHLECPVCSHHGPHEIYNVKEMMFGYRDVFQYLKCDNCGLLWLKDYPEDFSRYYPDNYFSLKKKRKFQLSNARGIFDQIRVRSELTNGVFHKISNLFFKRLDYLDWIKYADLNPNSHILDVGCGSGKLLQKMRLGGFIHTEGLDPFLNETIVYNNGLTIHKSSLENWEKQLDHPYDLIMLHHSYEHMPDPIETMQRLSSMLSPKGLLLIRIPLSDSLAWEQYHENWAQLDAPRHLYLHTKKSLTLAAEKSGLIVDKIVYDSTLGQFIASELYKHDLAGPDPDQIKKNIIKSLNMDELKKKTALANQQQKGDMAGFYLRKNSSL